MRVECALRIQGSSRSIVFQDVHVFGCRPCDRICFVVDDTDGQLMVNQMVQYGPDRGCIGFDSGAFGDHFETHLFQAVRFDVGLVECDAA